MVRLSSWMAGRTNSFRIIIFSVGDGTTIRIEDDDADKAPRRGWLCVDEAELSCVQLRERNNLANRQATQEYGCGGGYEEWEAIVTGPASWQKNKKS